MILNASLIKVADTIPRIEPFFEEPRTVRARPQDIREKVAGAVVAGSSYPLVTRASRTAMADARRGNTFDNGWTSVLAYAAAAAGFVTERWTGLSGVAVRAAIENAQPYVKVQVASGLRTVTDIDFSRVSANDFLWSTAGIVAAARKEPFAGTRPSFAKRIEGLDLEGRQRIIQHVVDTCTQLVDQHIARAAIVRTRREGSDLLVSVHLDTVPFGLWASRRYLRTTLDEQVAFINDAANAVKLLPPPAQATGTAKSPRPKRPAAISQTRVPPADRIVTDVGDLLTVREVARQLGVSTGTVYRLCERGALANVRVGAAIRVTPADLETYIGRRRTARQVL